MAPPRIPAEWRRILVADEAPNRLSAPVSRDPGSVASAYGFDEMWAAACGPDPARIRACARWWRARSDELAEAADQGPALVAALENALGDAAVTGPVREAVRGLAEQADTLGGIAALLDDAADALDTIRGRHAAALGAAGPGTAGLPGAVDGPDAAAADAAAYWSGDELAELRAAFTRACEDSAHAVSRVCAAVDDAVRAGAAPAASPGGPDARPNRV